MFKFVVCIFIMPRHCVSRSRNSLVLCGLWQGYFPDNLMDTENTSCILKRLLLLIPPWLQLKARQNMYAFACIHNANIIGQIFFKLFHLGALLKRPGAQVLTHSLCGTLRGQAAPTSKDFAVGSIPQIAASIFLLQQPLLLTLGTWN